MGTRHGPTGPSLRSASEAHVMGPRSLARRGRGCHLARTDRRRVRAREPGGTQDKGTHERGGHCRGGHCDRPGRQLFAVDRRTYPDGTLGIDSDGAIDFERHRFSGSARNSPGSASMLFFGGPNSGALIIADGLFVRTETGPWERQPDQATPLDPFLDRPHCRRPSRRHSPHRRSIRRSASPRAERRRARSSASRFLRLSSRGSRLRYSAIGVRTASRPCSPAYGPLRRWTGFPVLLETRVSAGTTATAITLRLTRLDPAPAIAPPIP